MSKFFIPTDRIGLESIQKSIGGTFSVINKMVKAGLAVNWHLNGLYFSETPLWPEGHYYQCGFSTEANAKSRTFLDEGDMLYEEVPTIPTALSFSLRPMSAAVYNGRGVVIPVRPKECPVAFIRCGVHGLDLRGHLVIRDAL